MHAPSKSDDASRSAPESRSAWLLLSVALLATAAWGLGTRPLGPNEAALLLDPGSPWAICWPLADRLSLSIELAARLPSLVLAGLAALLVADSGRLLGATGPAIVLTGSSPVFLAVGTQAGSEALAAALGALACWLYLRGGRARRASAAAVLLVALLLGRSLGLANGASARLNPVLAVWGLAFGCSSPPWHTAVAVPALGLLLGVAWRGRSLLFPLLGLVAALLGLLSPSPDRAVLAAAPLAPLLLLLLAHGSISFSPGIPRMILLTIAISVGVLAAANRLAGKDSLTPADQVPWDEAARMLAVLGEGDTTIVSAPSPPPAPLFLYAPAGGTTGGTRDERGAPPFRVMVVQHGLFGGVHGPAAAIEEGLVAEGYGLQGELLFGTIERGLARLVRRVSGATAADSYLRIRRYEKTP